MWSSPTTKSLDPIVHIAQRMGFPGESHGPTTCGFANKCPKPEALTTEASEHNINLLPYLTYCCIIWGLTYQTYSHVQKRHFNAIHHHSLKRQTISMFFQVIEYYASIFMFQKLNSTIHNVFYSYHTYETRNNLSIRTPLFKLQISNNSIFCHGIKKWNNLSPEIRSIANKSKFNEIIRKRLINET